MSDRARKASRQELRNACAFEALEGRVLMSATILAAPTNLVTTATTTSVQLHWKDNATTATGYQILRATDGVHFSQIATLTGATANTYTDARVASGHSYTYEVEAYNKTTTSAVSNKAAATTPLIAPTSLTATLSGLTINLAWTNKDTSATGYTILRSTDGKNYTTLATLNGANAKTYSDTTTTYGTTYSYEVVAFNAVGTSAASNVATKTTPKAGVTIGTRYGDELVVTLTGASDNVSILETGTTFTINADGQTYTDAALAGGLFLYTRGGADTINIDKTAMSLITVETIDGAATKVTSASADVIAWLDSTDTYTGAGSVHDVTGFAGGVTKATSAALANPTDSGKTITINASLFGTGPVASDVNQGEVGDCYFLSSLAAFAGQNPNVLVNSAVDMGDGTYAVQFMRGKTPTFVRVNNAFSAGPFAGLMYAHPGNTGSIWAMVFEKAFAYFRTGANTYASINAGWMGDVYSDFGVNSTNFYTSGFTDAAFFNLVSADLTNGKAVTLGTGQTPPNLVGGHAYTLVSAYQDSNGVTHYVVRNPWGVSGDAMENAQGYATLTFAQLKANFVDGCTAV
jgi:hypothetical protein